MKFQVQKLSMLMMAMLLRLGSAHAEMEWPIPDVTEFPKGAAQVAIARQASRFDQLPHTLQLPSGESEQALECSYIALKENESSSRPDVLVRLNGYVRMYDGGTILIYMNPRREHNPGDRIEFDFAIRSDRSHYSLFNYQMYKNILFTEESSLKFDVQKRMFLIRSSLRYSTGFSAIRHYECAIRPAGSRS